MVYFHTKPNNFKFFACSDANYAGDNVKRKSNPGIYSLLGRSIIGWSSELQRCLTFRELKCSTLQYITLFVIYHECFLSSFPLKACSYRLKNGQFDTK